MSNESTCPLCGSAAESNPDYQTDSILRVCNTCGRYKYFSKEFNSIDKDKLASYLFYHRFSPLDNRFYLISDKETFESIRSVNSNVYQLTKEMVDAWYPKTFAEKIDRIILYLSNNSKFYGDEIKFNFDEIASLSFFRRINANDDSLTEQLNFLSDFFKENMLVDINFPPIISMNEYSLKILPAGWKRVDELQKNQTNNKHVFVSMSFSEATKETREAIRKGIIGAEMSPDFIDEIIHNHQIVPEMFRLIKDCRLLVLDITDPNYGAYYEAGYALGLGKEVIITCSREMFNKEYTTDEEKKYAKYTRPHFDIAQKQILIWDNHDDLTKKLQEWIKAVV